MPPKLALARGAAPATMMRTLPLLGAALGTWCRKQVVILGLALVSIGSLCSALAVQSPWLESSRVVVAAGAAMAIPSTSAIAVNLFPDERPRALAFSMVALRVTLALTRFTEGRLWLIVALFVSWAIGNSFFGTLQQARVVEAAPASGSALLALNTSAIFAGQAVGTVIGGWVLATAGLRALPWTGAALAALALLLFAASRRARL